MDLIERVESYKVLFKECKALEPVSMALAKGYKSATPLQRLEIIRDFLRGALLRGFSPSI